MRARQERLKRLQADRSRRVRLLIEWGKITEASQIPEDSVPIDVETLTKTKLTVFDPYYTDIEFLCTECGKADCFYADAQQIYFEVTQASPHKRPSRCYDCRKIEVARKEEARKRAGHPPTKTKQ